MSADCCPPLWNDSVRLSSVTDTGPPSTASDRFQAYRPGATTSTGRVDRGPSGRQVGGNHTDSEVSRSTMAVDEPRDNLWTQVHNRVRSVCTGCG
ncbi:hypothetical protein Van01_19540 [Micromonospora andamanensis]|uniref:Uncharacterized protein n=1 Tax=Micromonospora andamanensis TaxID=1287068 RepID=A0ABQ4HSY4_9ACTN|nr:hypothetical protein Van01_19540 [Micromonospora andamanensis]